MYVVKIKLVFCIFLVVHDEIWRLLLVELEKHTVKHFSCASSFHEFSCSIKSLSK